MGQDPTGQSTSHRDDCPICVADGRNPNRETRQAIHQIENGEVYRYTDTLGSNVIRNILSGNNIKENENVDEVRESVLQREAHV